MDENKQYASNKISSNIKLNKPLSPSMEPVEVVKINHGGLGV